MKSFVVSELKTSQVHALLLGSVGPRPIAFASTIDQNGIRNLSPFSFFNVFSASPPILVFSPARRVRDNTTKHTLENIREIPEVVINIVNFALVQQTSLASVEYPKGTDEFIKAGLTPIASDIVRPFRVKESPVQIECKVNQVLELGQNAGAGNLVICEAVKIHVHEEFLTPTESIDQQKIDLVGRMGGDWYTRAHGSSIFEVEKPNTKIGIGIDALPESIKFNSNLSGNDLGQLGNVEVLPNTEEVNEFKNTDLYKALKLNPASIESTAKELLAKKQSKESLLWLLSN